MANPPLRSQDTTRPKDIQFKHFGVLDSGAQSKQSIFTSVTLNLILLAIAIVIGAATKATMDTKKDDVTLVTPIPLDKKPDPPKPEPKPEPKPLPKPPVVKPVPPKIKLPDVKVEPPKIPHVAMAKPMPVIMPAMPKQVVAAAAPKVTKVNLAQSASVVNNDAHPSPVALGHPDNPIAPSNRPATSAVNLGQRGLPGMPATNSGGGPRSSTVNLGSGQPGGSLSGTGTRAIAGVKLGVPGGTATRPGGNGVGTQAQVVQLGHTDPPPATRPPEATKSATHSAPTVIFKPNPVYTAEATALHLEGTVSVRIRVSASGAVQVLGVINGLGHGLDESAIRSIQGTRFRPALDGSGSPTDWEGVVNVRFQLAQ